MQSIAAVLEKINEPLKIMSLQLPPLKKGQVLVKIAYTGLCHSQLNEMEGKRGEDRFLPHTLGHEASGSVIDIGEGVSKVQKGDHVVLSWIRGKGISAPCAQYVYGKAVVNSGPISTFMTHAVISEDRVIRIDKDIPLKEAALLGCALPTGLGIVKNTLRMQPGRTIAVFGLGGIGMSALVGAHLMKASCIIAIDPVPEKLAVAKQLGAHHVIDVREESAFSAIMRITENQGVDYSVEAAGKKQVMEEAFRCVKNKTGLCVIAGNLRQDEKIEINPFDLILGKKIIGTWGGESDIEEDIPFYCDLIRKKKIRLAPMISDEFALDEINEAFKKLKEGKILRAMIRNV